MRIRHTVDQKLVGDFFSSSKQFVRAMRMSRESSKEQFDEQMQVWHVNC